MLLSIIVPTYNVEEYIANCLDSLLDQNISKEEYEILIINDGATDRSGEIAATYSEKFENVILINQENKGLSGARNTGIHLAKGKYTYFIDSDDYIAKKTLGLILSLLVEYELDILGVQEIETVRLDMKESSNSADIKYDSLKVTDGITYIAENNYLNNAWWYFINTDFLKATGLTFPVGRLVEDANFTAKLITSSQRMAYIPLDFYRYYLRPNSIMRKTNMDHIRRLIGDYEKNVYEFNNHLKDLRSKRHPKIKECIERIEARQHSFVFFQLIKSIKYGLPKAEVEKTIKGYKDINVYPINKFLGKDYKKLVYKILVPILNNKKLLLGLLKLKSITK